MSSLIFDFLVHKSSVSNFKIILIWFTNRNASKNKSRPTVIGTTFLELKKLNQEKES